MRRASASCLLLAAALAWPSTAAAQLPGVQPPARKGLAQPLEATGASDARLVRDELQQLLGEHSPNVGMVFRADPSLLQREDYLASYPRLAAFLKEHPEVARDPAFFFGGPNLGYAWFERERTAQERAIDAVQEALAVTAVFIGVLTAMILLAALIRQAVRHRRWVRQSRVQTEVHTKILDRLQSNEELLAYIQSPAGQQFLESGPSPSRHPDPPAIGAPHGRILWSVQAGVMLMALGIGLWLVQRNVLEEIAPAFGAMGTVAFVLGVGAISSAGLAYKLSSRLGLLGAAKE
jgi:hypothetical protein